jgi:hypothetical protein
MAVDGSGEDGPELLAKPSHVAICRGLNTITPREGLFLGPPRVAQ